MDMLFLIIYIGITLSMQLYYAFAGRGKYYEFPFWAGILAAGWFLPQAIGGYRSVDQFPDGAYSISMAFAALCNLFMWIGYELAVRQAPRLRLSWLDAPYNANKLFWAGAGMCVFGWFFQIKLWSLPEELLSQTQWTGAMVIYLFFANVFHMGFVTIWLVYISQGKWFRPRMLLFIVPSLLILANIAFVYGRRSVMMSLFSYVFVSLWFVRRLALPRMVMVTGVALGLILINSIGVYRSIMKDEDRPLKERISEAMQADYMTESKNNLQDAGHEFKNYVYVMALYATYGGFDYGGFHWNELVFSYVPGQLVGREFKKSLMVKAGMSAREASAILKEKFQYEQGVGTTISGYADSFGSFGWFGCLKFLIIGSIMGTLYRHAITGTFLGQMLYVYTLGTAMHCISHGTNRILTSVWVYFFALGFPILFMARMRWGSLQARVGR